MMTLRPCCWLSPLAALAVLAVSADARGIDANVDATSAFQSYVVSSPYGEPVVRRRRYTQTLGLSLYELVPPGGYRGPDLFFRSRLRLDGDLGQLDAERDPNRSGTFVPGLEQAPLDLMYAYLEGQRYLEGMLGFRLGRQHVSDALGFFGFDGALVRVTTPVFVEIESYAGLEHRVGLPMLASQRFEADGVYRGSRRNLEDEQWPEYLREHRLAPAFGVAVQSSDLYFLSARLSYRHVFQRDRVRTSVFVDPSSEPATVDEARTSDERLGAAVVLSDAGLGALEASVVHDVYLSLLTEYAIGIDWYAGERLTLGGRLDYYLPTFDGDSVFNWFGAVGSTTLQARAELALTRSIDLGGSAGLRFFEDPDTGSTGKAPVDYTVHGEARYRSTSVHHSAVGRAEFGDSGHRVGVDLGTKRWFRAGKYDALALVSVYDWRNEMRRERSATSFTYVLGGGFLPASLESAARLGLEWEHGINRLIGHHFRMLATLDFALDRELPR